MFDLTRLESLAKINGISKTHLCSLVGRPKYYLNDIRNKGTQVPDDYVAVWADALNTTPEYLKGETDIKEKPASESADGLDKEFSDLIKQLSPEQRELVKAQIKGILSNY